MPEVPHRQSHTVGTTDTTNTPSDTLDTFIESSEERGFLAIRVTPVGYRHTQPSKQTYNIESEGTQTLTGHTLGVV